MEKIIKRVAKAAAFNNTRLLVFYLNKEGIAKSDIVSIIKELELVILIYYGAE